MLPTLFEVGGVSVPAYAVCTILAYSLGFWWLHRGARRVLSDADALPGLFIALMIGGGLGARLMHIVGGEGLVSPAAIWAELTSTVTGLAFLGGVVGGTAGAMVYMLWARLPALKLLGVAAPGRCSGIGALGMPSAGCCHGRVVPWTWQPLVASGGGPSLPRCLPVSGAFSSRSARRDLRRPCSRGSEVLAALSSPQRSRG